MKHLPDILALQRDLVKWFQNVAELTGTIQEFLNTQNTGREAVSGDSAALLFPGKCSVRVATHGKMSCARA